jgi:16S rRNA processing protein RimM
MLVDEAQNGAEVGPIGEVYEMPQQVMLGVLVQGVEALVPLHDDFLVRLDKANKRLHLRLPAGLVDVFLDREEDQKH